MITRGWSIAAKLAYYIDRRNLDQCWEWRGARQADGYGTIKLCHKSQLAHRVVWEETHGAIPAGLIVRHRICDNPPCCNPAHLCLGTHADNKADSVEKGRHKFQRLPGDAHGMARLSPQQVVAIRDDRRAQRSIAADYGISQPHVSDIKTGRKWSHI